MSRTIENPVLFLIGLCRESQRSLASAAWTARNEELRHALLDAFDQRTDMLDDLERLAPEAGQAESVHIGWRARDGDDDAELLTACLAGEEATLQAAKALWVDREIPELRHVLQTHVVRISGLLATFRSINSR